MGCAQSSGGGGGADHAHSNEVDKDLIRQRMASLYHFKLLLLGAGESGKSTIIKQLRSIHDKKFAFTEQEMVTVANSLHQNVLECTKAMIAQAKKGGEYEELDEAMKKVVEEVREHDENNPIPPELGDGIVALIASGPMQKVWARRNEFWLLDSFEYYLENLPRFCNPGASEFPNKEDVFRARIRTTGITDYRLMHPRPQVAENEPKHITFQVVDVGGQRNERKKWINCFSDVKCVLFVVSLAGYDQVLFEDATQNRMEEAIHLFEQTVKEKAFATVPFFVFFNKKDLFERMLQETPLTTLFPDYTGPQGNVHAAIDYVKEVFRSKIPKFKHPDNVTMEVVTGVLKMEVKQSFDTLKRELITMNTEDIQQEQKALQERLNRL